ncbi:hypothetical protein REPUB_Repub19eG0021400 [Reevesia pubescens]
MIWVKWDQIISKDEDIGKRFLGSVFFVVVAVVRLRGDDLVNGTTTQTQGNTNSSSVHLKLPSGKDNVEVSNRTLTEVVLNNNENRKPYYRGGGGGGDGESGGGGCFGWAWGEGGGGGGGGSRSGGGRDGGWGGGEVGDEVGVEVVVVVMVVVKVEGKVRDGDGEEEGDEAVGINGDVKKQNLGKAREEEGIVALIKRIGREFSTRRIIS